MSAIDKYRDLLSRLIPSGRAWNAQVGAVFYETLEGLAVELSRVDSAAYQLIEDVDPRTTNQLIDEWESLVGIPDDCQDRAVTIEERRRDVVRKLTNRGGASRAFFTELANLVGYTVTITEPFPFRAGRGRSGGRIYGVLWKFWFQVNATDYNLRVFLSGAGRCGDSLRTFRNDVLECVIRRSAPAHTKVQFLYGS